MATYNELMQLFSNNDLKNRITVACIVAAEAIRIEDAGTTNHANRLVWAKSAFENPSSIASAMLLELLAANKEATVANITGATDATIQSKVDAAVNIFATG